MNRFILSLVVFLSAFLSTIDAKELHVLLAADTLSDVKKASKKDLLNMQEELLEIAEATGLTVHVKELFHHKLTFSGISKWIKESDIQPDDIVLLYYTGHGLRTEKTQTIWPAIYFPPKREIVEFTDLIDLLLSRPAALYIAFADCCNNFVKNAYLLEAKGNLLQPSGVFQPTAKSSHFDLAGVSYRKLFMNTRGVIIASGSIPGKRSWCTERGGIFTNAFLTSLRSELDKADPQWENIFKKAKVLCHHFQKPQFEVNIGKTSRY